jgi:hypothetical protein
VLPPGLAEISAARLVVGVQREAPRADLLNAGAVHGNGPLGSVVGPRGRHESRVDPVVVVRDGSGVGGRNARPRPCRSCTQRPRIRAWVWVRGVDPETHSVPRDQPCLGN